MRQLVPGLHSSSAGEEEEDEVEGESSETGGSIMVGAGPKMKRKGSIINHISGKLGFKCNLLDMS